MTDPIERALAEIKFGPDGLVPAIAQQHDTGEILMMAWMNRDAVRASLTEGRACYWSRSRAKLWRKGETSGQIQLLREMRPRVAARRAAARCQNPARPARRASSNMMRCSASALRPCSAALRFSASTTSWGTSRTRS